MLWPKIPCLCFLPVTSSNNGPQLKRESIFDIFGIVSRTAVKTERRSRVWRCVYCKHWLQNYPLSSAAPKAPRRGQRHFGVFISQVLCRGLTGLHTSHAEVNFRPAGIFLCPSQGFRSACVCLCVLGFFFPTFAQIPNLKAMNISSEDLFGQLLQLLLSIMFSYGFGYDSFFSFFCSFPQTFTLPIKVAPL